MPPPALPHAATLLTRWNLPLNASVHGVTLDRHLILNLWIAFALLILAHLILLIGLLASRRPQSTHIGRIEYIPLLALAIPLLALAILFTALAVKAERLWAATRYTGADPTALQVEVTGTQFVWYFRYPGPDATFGTPHPQLVAPAEGNPLGLDRTDPHSADDLVTSQLVLPVNREVDLRLHALDVIHGFSIPEMRLKQNAIPGQTVHLHFTPTTPGTYAILCTQLCGSGHYRMNATLRVVTPDQFKSWLASNQKAATP
jgi:cytochrome c oxidase subunit 2